METGQQRWASSPTAESAELDVLAVGETGEETPPCVAGTPSRELGVGGPGPFSDPSRNHALGARLACYSPGWGLLALACRRTAALREPRRSAGLARSL